MGLALLLLTYATRSLRRIAANQTSQPKVILRLDSRGRPPGGPAPTADRRRPDALEGRYAARVGGVAKMLGLLNNLFWAVLVACLTFEFAKSAILDVLSYGYGGRIDSPNRMDLNTMLRAITPWIAGFWLLGTTTTAASSIASERRGRHLDQPDLDRPRRRGRSSAPSCSARSCASAGWASRC